MVEKIQERDQRDERHQSELEAGSLGQPRGMGWGGRWEGVSGRGTHVHP